MKEHLKLILKLAWISPVSLVAFMCYILPCWAMGWYEFAGVRGPAFLWLLCDRTPDWLRKLWDGWSGHTLGNLIVMTNDPESSTRFRKVLVHELHHVDQGLRLGVFSPILYGLCFLSGKLLWKVDGYKDHPMEVDARRVADEWELEQRKNEK